VQEDVHRVLRLQLCHLRVEWLETVEIGRRSHGLGRARRDQVLRERHPLQLVFEVGEDGPRCHLRVQAAGNRRDLAQDLRHRVFQREHERRVGSEAAERRQVAGGLGLHEGKRQGATRAPGRQLLLACVCLAKHAREHAGHGDQQRVARNSRGRLRRPVWIRVCAAGTVSVGDGALVHGRQVKHRMQQDLCARVRIESVSNISSGSYLPSFLIYCRAVEPSLRLLHGLEHLRPPDVGTRRARHVCCAVVPVALEQHRAIDELIGALSPQEVDVEGGLVGPARFLFEFRSREERDQFSAEGEFAGQLSQRPGASGKEVVYAELVALFEEAAPERHAGERHHAIVSRVVEHAHVKRAQLQCLGGARLGQLQWLAAHRSLPSA